MAKRARSEDGVSELHFEGEEGGTNLPNREETVVCEEKTTIPDQVPAADPVAVEDLGDGPFWSLLAQAGYTSW